MESTDKHVNMVNEMLNGVRIIKYFAWFIRRLLGLWGRGLGILVGKGRVRVMRGRGEYPSQHPSQPPR
ncbi:hypothetical protein BC829DRAFT_410861 [Chytridium lagenaria]|nr:hypothetical protein BC829DRAFT_410861 [Chytridium lagenaria]